MAEARRIVIPYGPRPPVVAFHNSQKRYRLLVGHRRLGKTVACVNELIRAAATAAPRKAPPRFGYVAPTYGQAKEVAWSYLKHYTAPIPGLDVRESDLQVTLPNGAMIRLYGADNYDRMRGLYFDGVVMDEPADIDPRAYPEVIRPALSDYQGWAVFIGTPKGQDAFYRLYVSGMKDPDWDVFTVPVTISGVLPEGEIEAARSQMTKDQFAREYLCSFDVAGDAQFIDFETVDLAKGRVKAGRGPLVMGIDVARFGDDRTAFLIRRDGIEHIEVHQGIDTMQTAARAVDLIGQYRPDAVFVDGVGVGGGVVDRIRQVGHRCIDVGAGNKAIQADRYANRRAEMWGRMREWLREHGSIAGGSRYHAELIADLTAPKHTYDAANRVLIEKKDDMKKRGVPSPDLADALALTFAQAVADPSLAAANPWVGSREPEMADPMAGW